VTSSPAFSNDAPARRRLGANADRITAGTAVVNFTLAGVWVVLYLVLLVSGRTRGADYTAFYTGWRLVLEGQGPHLYDPVAQAVMQGQVLGGQAFEAGLNPFNNPPHTVLPFVPLGMLPLEVSFLVWTGLQLLLLAGVLRMLLLGPARDWSRGERIAVTGWLIGLPALGITFWQGAFSLMLVAGVLGTYLAILEGRDRIGALALVAASIKPQGMVGVAVAVLIGRGWSVVAAAGVAGGTLALMATVVLGPGIWREYLDFLGRYASTFDRYSVEPTVMWNLRGTLALLLGREQAQLINVIALTGFALGMLLTAFLWRRGWSPTAPAQDVAARFGLTVALGLLLSPHLNPHDDLLLIVPAVLAYAAWRGSLRAPLLAIAIGLAPAVIAFTNGVDAAAPTALPIRVPTLLIVGLVVVLVAALRRGNGVGDVPAAGMVPL
jgi:hypothetical protein